VGGSDPEATVRGWPLSKLKRYRDYYTWLQRRELAMRGVDLDELDSEDGTPKWSVDEGSDPRAHAPWDAAKVEVPR